MYYTSISFHLSPGPIFSSTFSSSVPFLPQLSLLSFGTPLLCHLLICLPLHIGMLSSFSLFFLAIHTVAGLGFSVEPTWSCCLPTACIYFSCIYPLNSLIEKEVDFVYPRSAASLPMYLIHLSRLLRLFILHCSFCPSLSCLSACPAGSSLGSGCPRQMLSKPCFSAEPCWIPAGFLGCRVTYLHNSAQQCEGCSEQIVIFFLFLSYKKEHLHNNCTSEWCDLAGRENFIGKIKWKLKKECSYYLESPFRQVPSDNMHREGCCMEESNAWSE